MLVAWCHVVAASSWFQDVLKQHLTLQPACTSRLQEVASASLHHCMRHCIFIKARKHSSISITYRQNITAIISNITKQQRSEYLAVLTVVATCQLLVNFVCQEQCFLSASIPYLCVLKLRRRNCHTVFKKYWAVSKCCTFRRQVLVY